MGASVLVTDDADGFKTVADEIGVQHQVCKAHVVRNTETLIERYQPLVAKDADGSLKAIGVSPEQAAADVTRLGELVKSRQKEQAPELEALHRRYLERCATARRRTPKFGLSSAALVSGPLESLASLDALPDLERTQGRNVRWHQQCL